jgi:hypothetical protein
MRYPGHGTTVGRTLAIAVSLAAVLLLAAPSTAAQQDDLDIEVDAWCPPQLEGCLEPREPCATYAEPDRWMGVELALTHEGDPASFVEVALTYATDEGPREKTASTDADGEVSFALRNAENVAVEATSPDGDRSGHRALAPTWGNVSLEDPDVSGQPTVDEQASPSVPYTVEGWGPPGSPPGSVTVEHADGDERSTLRTDRGRLTGTIESTTAGVVDYNATGGDVCGLPLAEDAGFQVEWDAGPAAELTLDCPADLPGNTQITCDAHGLDAYQNPAPVGEVDWSATPSYDDPNAGFLETTESSAQYLLPGQGSVDLGAAAGNLTANRTLDVTDEGGPVLQAVRDGVETGDPLSLSLWDASGIATASASYRGHTLDTVEPNGSEEATLETVLREGGDFEIEVHAEDTGGSVARHTTTVTVEETDRRVGTSSSASNSGSPTTTSTTEDRTLDPVQAERTSEDVYEAEVQLGSGQTPVVEAPNAGLQAEIDATDHDELVVRFTPETREPVRPPGLPVRSFDVSATTAASLPAEIDEARLEVGIAQDELEGLGVDADTLALFHWTDRRWEQVDTRASTAGDQVRLAGTVSSLSPFAVVVPDVLPDGEVLELTSEEDRLPATYRGEIRTSEEARDLHARTEDGAFAFSLELQRPGSHAFEVTIRDSPADGQPRAVTEVGRYVDATVTGPDGVERDLSDATNVTYTLDTADLPHEGDRLLPVTVDEGTWQPLHATLARSEGNVTVTTSTSRGPLMGLVADTQPPRTGLQDPLDGPLAGETEIPIVASDNLALDRVRVLSEGAVLDEDDERPFALTVDGDQLSTGSATLVFEAVDRAGNVGETSRTVDVVEDDLDESATEADPEPAPAARQDTPSLGLLGLASALTASAIGARRRL